MTFCTPLLTQFFHLQHQNWRNPYPLGSYSCGIPSQIASEILPYYSLHFIVSEGERGGDTTPTLGKETNYLLLTTIFSPSALFMGGVPCPNSFRCDQPILVREDYVRILSLIQSLLQWMGVLLWQALDKVFKTILFSLLRAPTYFSTSLTLPCWKTAFSATVIPGTDGSWILFKGWLLPYVGVQVFFKRGMGFLCYGTCCLVHPLPSYTFLWPQ